MGEQCSTVVHGEYGAIIARRYATYLVCREEQDIRTRGVHLVTLTRVNCLLLDGLDLEWFEFLVEHLTKIHNDRFVDLLPQMGTEDLDQTDLQGGDFTVPISIIKYGVAL